MRLWVGPFQSGDYNAQPLAMEHVRDRGTEFSEIVRRKRAMRQALR